MNYNASAADQLFGVHESGGFVDIGSLRWTQATGLGGSPGALSGSGDTFTLQLGATTGVMSAAVPEPSSVVLLVMGLVTVSCLRRRRMRG